jgi:acetyltransferase-like isoleucine patch superfamily enzyme
MADFFSHPSALVESSKIGKDTRIWAFVHILHDVYVGSNCNICDHCFIENSVKIGNNVTIKSGVHIWKGVVIEDDVFVGPNTAFTNDIRPRSKHFVNAIPTLIKKGASLGAGTTVLAGITIGEYAMTGIGSVVTRDIPAYALFYGNPARFRGWIDEMGNKLSSRDGQIWESSDHKKFILKNGALSPMPI